MINKNMKIAELLELNVGDEKINKIAETLFSFGMHCLGCAMASGETLEEAAMVHGIDIDETKLCFKLKANTHNNFLGEVYDRYRDCKQHPDVRN